MQHRVGAEILPDPAIESRERVGGREAALEQQAHRIALDPERRLDADEDVAERRAEHQQVASVGVLPARCRTPVALDLGEVPFAPHVVVDADPRADVRVGAVALGIAGEDPLAQRIDARRHIDRVAAVAERAQRVEQRP